MDSKTYCDEWRQYWEHCDPSTVDFNSEQPEIITSVLKGGFDAVLHSLLLAASNHTGNEESIITPKSIWEESLDLANENNPECMPFQRKVLDSQLRNRIIWGNDPLDNMAIELDSKMLGLDNLRILVNSISVGDAFNLSSGGNSENIIQLTQRIFGEGIFDIGDDIKPSREQSRYHRKLLGTWDTGFMTLEHSCVFGSHTFRSDYNYLLYTFMMLNSVIQEEGIFFDYIGRAFLDDDRKITVNREDLVYAILTRRAIIFDDPLFRIKNPVNLIQLDEYHNYVID